MGIDTERLGERERVYFKVPHQHMLSLMRVKPLVHLEARRGA